MKRTSILCVVLLLLVQSAANAQESRPTPSPPKANASSDAKAAAKALIIVVPRALVSALDGFIAKKRLVRPVEVLLLEDLLRDATGADDAEKLKRTLYARSRAIDLGYVLLVGDADIMPVRYMMLDRCTEPAFHTAFYPSDLYYADLTKADGTFEDWNGRKDGFHAGYFGEVHGEAHKDGPINFDAIDYRPEIAVGRWPVSNAEETARVAQKSIAFEESAAEPATAMRTAVMVHAEGWIDARAATDDWLKNLPHGYRAERLYYKDAARDDKTPPPTEPEIIKAMNAGAGLVFHVGHGNDDQWAYCFGMGALAKLTNAKTPAVMMSIGCSTARFATMPPYEPYVDRDGREHAGSNAGEVFLEPPPPPAVYQKGRLNPTGLGESLVRSIDAGAAAYIGCNTGGQPCATTLLAAFLEALGEVRGGRPILGDLWASAVRAYWSREHLADLRPNADWYPPSIFFQAMKYMVFGDPSLALPATD